MQLNKNKTKKINW